MSLLLGMPMVHTQGRPRRTTGRLAGSSKQRGALSFQEVDLPSTRNRNNKV